MAELEHISNILLRTDIMKNFKKWALKNMEIVCDTREKENSHIIHGIEQLGGKYIFESLKTADYAYKLGGVLCTELLIERKNSLSELAANITKHRDRFENELKRALNNGSRLIILIENDDLNALFEEKYKSDVSANAFLATLFTYQERYNVEIATIHYQHVGRYIFNRFYYHVREVFKNNIVS